MDVFSVLILLFVSSALQSLFLVRYQSMQRARQIAAIEKQRGSRVITTKETSGSKNGTFCAS